MISKYKGTCYVCGGPTKPGDRYDVDTRLSFHDACISAAHAALPDGDAYELAERLGFTNAKDLTWE